MNFLIHSIFQYFQKKDEWTSPNFTEFVLVLMIFNGGKTRMDGHIDFDDFYSILQKYCEYKQAG